MKNKIIISKPYIKECDSNIFGKAVRLCAKITMINPNSQKKETKECFFEFEKKYREYLVDSRSDAFVMGLLTTAMENNNDIEFEAPISERLFYQLTNYYIPMVSKYNMNYPLNDIKLIGSTDDAVITNKSAVATGCSGGVDSFYTIYKHSKCENCKNNKITHLVFSSSGSDVFDAKKLKKSYIQNYKKIDKISKDSELELIACYNNLYEFYKHPFKGFITFFTTTFGSIAYALQKLISVYYASSGTPIENFNMDISKTNGFDGSAFDVFTVSCMNTENLTFYSSGVEVNRNEKISAISNYKIAQDNLIVCGLENTGFNEGKFCNCSHCKKCLRTMLSLYVINKLSAFSKVFDVDDFLRHKSKRIGKVISEDQSDFTKVSFKTAKENGVRISFTSYLYGYIIYKPIKTIRRLFRNSKFMRRIYYKFNLDYKFDGYRGANYDYYKDKIGR